VEEEEENYCADKFVNLNTNDKLNFKWYYMIYISSLIFFSKILINSLFLFGIVLLKVCFVFIIHGFGFLFSYFNDIVYVMIDSCWILGILTYLRCEGS